MRTHDRKLVIATAVHLNKCLKHIKLPITLYMITSISELPSNISTMVETVFVTVQVICLPSLGQEHPTHSHNIHTVKVVSQIFFSAVYNVTMSDSQMLVQYWVSIIFFYTAFTMKIIFTQLRSSLISFSPLSIMSL